MTTPEARVKASSPAGTWTIELPLTASEQFDTTANDRAMRATQISVNRNVRDQPAQFMLLGLDIQQDGSPRRRNVGRYSDLEEFSSRCPETYRQVISAALALVGRIQRDADRAEDEIRSALALPKRE
jgi:hypothetical protein